VETQATQQVSDGAAQLQATMCLKLSHLRGFVEFVSLLDQFLQIIVVIAYLQKHCHVITKNLHEEPISI
jgi:hypothetical protein